MPISFNTVQHVVASSTQCVDRYHYHQDNGNEIPSTCNRVCDAYRSCIGCRMFAGYGMSTGERSWLHTIGFAEVMAVTVYVILDVEYPRFVFIRIDYYVDHVLKDLLKSMK
jgi:hypothetical protein